MRPHYPPLLTLQQLTARPCTASLSRWSCVSVETVCLTLRPGRFRSLQLRPVDPGCVVENIESRHLRHLLPRSCLDQGIRSYDVIVLASHHSCGRMNDILNIHFLAYVRKPSRVHRARASTVHDASVDVTISHTAASQLREASASIACFTCACRSSGISAVSPFVASSYSLSMSSRTRFAKSEIK